MRNHQSHRPGPEIDITLASNEVRWQRQGEAVSQSAAFSLPEDTQRELKDGYTRLVNASRKPDGRKYKGLEKDLGESLAGALLRRGDRDNELATALNGWLSSIGNEEYVRLLLRFEDPNLAKLPWELTMWKSRETGREICLGRHGDLALSRFERPRSKLPPRIMRGEDGILSILNIGTELHGARVFDRTSAFIRLIDDHIPQVHSASRQLAHLKRYWRDCFKLLGGHPEIDIVQWNGHGSRDGMWSNTSEGNYVSLSAAELIERTQGAFLYVVHACDSGGNNKSAAGVVDGPDLGGGDALERYDTFSSTLLDHGASAVLGMHSSVDVAQFEYLPILYALLVQGLPLDYCVQYMRRFFWNGNADNQDGPYEPWYKLLLWTSCASYLDGKSSAPLPSSSEVLVLDTLVPAYARSLEAERGAGLSPEKSGAVPEGPGPRRVATDALLQRFYDTALMK